MLVNWIRFFLFIAVLAVLSVAALLHWNRSDQDVVKSLRRGVEHARRDALALGRATSETLSETGEVINEQSRALQAESEQLRQQINESSRAQRLELAEHREAAREQVEQIEAEALSWKDKLVADLEQAAAQFRRWWAAQTGAD